MVREREGRAAEERKRGSDGGGKEGVVGEGKGELRKGKGRGLGEREEKGAKEARGGRKSGWGEEGTGKCPIDLHFAFITCTLRNFMDVGYMSVIK